ncbi:MAG: hypothetical protein NVS1B4_18970 [Gemmatimonadaceae bacterium]
MLFAAGLVSGCAGGIGTQVPRPSTTFVIAATTDVHGRLRGWDYYLNVADSARGLARAATVFDSLRAAHPGRVITVDAGDLLQGNPLAYVAARVASDTLHPIIAAMNAAAYDAAVVGNHEFNFGLEVLDRSRRQARFPLLGANIDRQDGGAAFPRSHIIERGGVRVGIVGGTTPGAVVWDRDVLSGRVTVGDIIPAVRMAVDDVRARGVDVVVVLLHSGLMEPASYDTVATGVASENVAGRVAREVAGVDVVVYGHSHKEMVDTTIAGTLLVQPRNWAASVAVATLTLAPHRGAGRRWDVIAKRGTTILATGHAESHAILQTTERAHRATVAYALTPLGTTPISWRSDSARIASTPVMQFILETMRGAAGSQLAATAAFSVEASLGPGPITVADVARLYPYDNTLRAVRITGDQLRAYLERSAFYFRDPSAGRDTVLDPAIPGYNFDIVSGVTYTIDISRPLGRRITRLEWNGRPVAAADTFTIALSSYRQTGGGGFSMLRGAPVVYDRQQDIRQLLVDEIRRQRTLIPDAAVRDEWHVEPSEAAGRAYRAMHSRSSR